MKVYLSGPMTGLPDFNFHAFGEAAATLRARGWGVVSPAELDEADGYTPSPDGAMPDRGTYARLLARDVETMVRERVEAVVVLPGWQSSGGAKVEVAFARALGLPIYAYPGLERIDRSTKVAEATTPAGEERIVNAATGGEKGRKPQRFELLPWEALGEVAEVYAFGASKYEDHNWLRGYDWSLSFGALGRHLAAFWSGQDRDDESGLPHLAHAAFHVLALLTFARSYPDLDDRSSTVLAGKTRP